MTSEVQHRIDVLGEQLRRSVVLNDTAVRTTHASRHYGDEDEVRVRGVLHRDAGSPAIAHVLAQGVQSWTRPGRIPPAPEIGMVGRLLVPVQWHGERLGAVLVIDADESLTSEEIALVEDFAREAAGLIVADRHLAQERANADEADAGAWLGADPGARERARIRLVSRGRLPDLDHVCVLVVDLDEHADIDTSRARFALRQAFAAVRGRWRGTALWSVAKGSGALAVLSATVLTAGVTADLADRLTAEVHEFLGRSRPVRVGIGDDLGAPDAWRSRRQAGLAARAVPFLDGGPVVRWDTLGPLQILMRVPPEELDDDLVPRPVADLAAADPSGRLLDTLAAYLAHGGAGSATAAALHIHRTSLYYRLDRIRDILGVNLDDGLVRLELHLGLVARRVVQRNSGR